LLFILNINLRLEVRKTYSEHSRTIPLCIATMVQFNSNFKYSYGQILRKSLFTERQFSIIYKRVTEHSRVEDISSGAYYRQLKQCRNKINSILYSILLLRLIGAVDSQALFAIEKISNQLSAISEDDIYSDIRKDKRLDNVMPVIYRLVDTMCKV
jgi:hypothetical protein